MLTHPTVAGFCPYVITKSVFSVLRPLWAHIQSTIGSEQSNSMHDLDLEGDKKRNNIQCSTPTTPSL